jgi:hypothetical protein
MSMKLLYHLNGTNKGIFKKWLTNFKGEPRIAWYPSAGNDFRDLLYLSAKFSELEPALNPELEPQPPDIFLHTDYFPSNIFHRLPFSDELIVHQDTRTTISVTSSEELPVCNLPLDDEIVVFKGGNRATGRVLFLHVEIQSNILGNFNAPVLYAFVENAAFCARKILPYGGRLSHIVHVRFGGGIGGGGRSTGIWLLNILQRVHCEVLVSDNSYMRQSGDERIYALYPSLAGDENADQFEKIRTIESRRWSEHGNVTWGVVRHL